MHIPMSIFSQSTYVRTFDVEAMKANQGPVPDRLRAAVAHSAEIAKRNEQAGSASSTAVSSVPEKRHNTASKILLAKAKADLLGPESLVSESHAKKYASRALSSFQSFIGNINRRGDGDLTVGGRFNAFFRQEHVEIVPEFGEMNERMQDFLEADRVQLFAEAQIFAKTFGIDEPIYEVKDGKVQIRAFDIEYNGEKIMRSLGNGKTAEYRENGTLKVDSYA